MAETKASEPKVVNAKRQITLDDIKFNEAKKTYAILAWFLGIIMYFIESEDLYVKYVAIEATLIGIVVFLLSTITGGLLACLLGPAAIVILVMGIMKINKGERFDMPVISDLSVKIMNAF